MAENKRIDQKNQKNQKNQRQDNTGQLQTHSKPERKNKKIIIIAAVALIAAILIGVPGIRALNDKRYDEQIAVAEKAYFKGDYEKAEQEYLKAVDMNSSKTRAREGLAYVYAVEGKFDQAKEVYTELYDDTGEEKYLPPVEDAEQGRVTTHPLLIIGVSFGTEKEQTEKTVTEMNEEMKKDLISLLNCFQVYRNLSSTYGESEFFNYDCSKAADCGIIGTIMGDMSWYEPLKKYSATGYDTEYTSGKIDPLGKAVDGSMWSGYHAADAEMVNWVAENIFNASKEEINKEIEYSSGMNGMEGERLPMYLYEGKYYRLDGWKGYIGADIAIDDIAVDGYYFIVSYREYYQDGSFEDSIYKAKMQYKIIDGKGYWSMYTREKQ